MAMESKHIVSLLIVSIILIVLYMSYSGKKHYKKDKKKSKSVKENFVDEMMREDNGTFSLFNWGGNDESDDNIVEEETIEHFPQATPMNVIYTDTNGNLSNTSDLGLQNLTVNSDTKLSGNVGIGGVLTSTNAGVELNGANLAGPSANTRINSQGIIFGGANNGRESNSAQISAGKHDADALCIVGMSKADGSNRRMHMWAESGTTHEGEITSNLRSGAGQFRACAGSYGTIFRQDGDMFYILNTNADDSMGSWNSLRPFYIKNSTGNVGMNQNLYVAGNISTDSNISAKGKIQEGGNALVPRGTIVMWHGSTAPAGWALCDGGNETPDLRGRFVLSQGNSGEAGSTNHLHKQTGGEETHVLSVKEMPSHTHMHNHLPAYFADANGNAMAQGGGTKAVPPKWETDATGGGEAHNNMPPYYVLAYIMKL